MKRSVLVLTVLMGMALFSISFQGQQNGALGQKKTFKEAKEKIISGFESEKAKIVRGPEEMRLMLAEIQKDIVKRNLTFVAEINEMMKYRIADITGASVPKDIDVSASQQYNRGQYLWGYFLEQYKQYLRDKIQDDRDRYDENDNKKNEGTIDDSDRDDRYRDDSKKDEYRDDDSNKKDEQYTDNTDRRDLDRIENLDTDIENNPVPTMAAFSWAARGKVTPVRFQNTCGSCWAFTSTAVIESNFLIRKKLDLDLSEQQLLDCAVDNAGRRAGSCGGGWYGKVFEYLMKSSVTTENVVPYKNSDQFCRPVMPSQYKIAAWGYLRKDAGIPTVEEMKTALCRYGPIAACIKVTPAFQAYASGVFNEFAATYGQRDINHAITIVGWNDAKRAYHVKNSWGSAWGENGYCWVEYGCNNIGYGATWVLVTPEMK